MKCFLIVVFWGISIPHKSESVGFTVPQISNIKIPDINLNKIQLPSVHFNENDVGTIGLQGEVPAAANVEKLNSEPVNDEEGVPMPPEMNMPPYTNGENANQDLSDELDPKTMEQQSKEDMEMVDELKSTENELKYPKGPSNLVTRNDFNSDMNLNNAAYVKLLNFTLDMANLKYAELIGLSFKNDLTLGKMRPQYEDKLMRKIMKTYLNLDGIDRETLGKMSPEELQKIEVAVDEKLANYGSLFNNLQKILNENKTYVCTYYEPYKIFVCKDEHNARKLYHALV